MSIVSDFNNIFDTHREELYRNETEWKQLIETGHPNLVPFREGMLNIGGDEVIRCALCYVPQEGCDEEVKKFRSDCNIKDLDSLLSEAEHKIAEHQGEYRVTRRSKRNELFCNCCDAYIEAFPGGADVEIPILITDVRRSTPVLTQCTPAQGAVLGLELRRQVSEIASQSRGYMLQDRGDGFMHSFPYGFAPIDIDDKKTWALDLAVRAAVRLADETVVPAPSDSKLRLGIGLSHGSTYVGAPDIDVLPNQLDMILVLGSATATVSARLSDLAEAGTAVVAQSTFEESGIDASQAGWKVETVSDAIVPAVRITP